MDVNMTDKEAKCILEAIEWEITENNFPPRGYFAALKRVRAKINKSKREQANDKT